MRYLLDTCTLLWVANGDYSHLSSTASQIFKDPTNEVAISAVSLWELAMKAAVGKLPFPGGSVSALTTLCARQHIEVLSLDAEHIQQFLVLPPNHPDPFDRLIAAVSVHDASNSQIIVSPDTSFDAYAGHGVVRVW